MKNPELQAIRGEIEQSLQARIATEPAEETLQTEAVETLPSIEEGAEEAMLATGEEQTAEQVIASINDLAAAHGIDPEEFYKLPIKLGGDREIPLGEAKDRIAQIDTERQQIEQQRQALAQQQQELQARAAHAQQAQAQLTERQAQAQQTLAGIAAQYRTKMQEWDKRRDIEPGKVALEQQEMGTAYAAAQQELQTAQGEAQAQASQAQQQWMMQQHAQLSQAIPEWNEPEKRKGLQQELQQFAVERYQATPQELQRLDARTIMLLRDAMEGRRAKAEAEKALAAVQGKAPVVPRTARKAAQQQQRADVAELETRALTTGKRQHKLAAARAILGR